MRTMLLLAIALATFTAPLGGAALPPDGEGPGVHATHHVHMFAGPVATFLYDPPVLVAKPGDTVIFHSHDILHTSTSGILTETEVAESLAPSSLHLNSFNTGLVGGGLSASVTLTGEGAYPYYCQVGFHRLLGMHGVIVVKA